MKNSKILEEKLELWNSRAFILLLMDLAESKGIECDIRQSVVTLRKLYLARLKEISPKSKYIQGELEFKDF